MMLKMASRDVVTKVNDALEIYLGSFFLVFFPFFRFLWC